jgi:hypothetical protein
LSIPSLVPIFIDIMKLLLIYVMVCVYLFNLDYAASNDIMAVSCSGKVMVGTKLALTQGELQSRQLGWMG